MVGVSLTELEMPATCLSLSTLVREELAQRAELKHLVMVHVSARCAFGKGYVKRGVLNQHVYQQLGFHGQPGNHFGKFMKKVLADSGIRVSYSRGQRVYYGLVWKELCQDPEESSKLNLENLDLEN